MDLKYHTPLRVMIKLELDNLPSKDMFHAA